MMKIGFPRRQFLRLAAGAVALASVPGIAGAQAYPTRPITMVVPFAPGGPSDVIGRIFAERMRVSLGQPIIIENAHRRGRQHWDRPGRSCGRRWLHTRPGLLGYARCEWRSLHASVRPVE